jgi:hypothetical protein
MLEPKRPRILFDINGGVEHEIRLSFFGSLRDIAALGGELREGMTVTLYDDGDAPDDLEFDAILRRDPESDYWLTSIVSEVRYVSRN